MGLFKEFKDDFSQAVNELVPGDVPEKEVEPKAQTADNLVVDTIGENVDVASELSKLDDPPFNNHSYWRFVVYEWSTCDTQGENGCCLLCILYFNRHYLPQRYTSTIYVYTYCS